MENTIATLKAEFVNEMEFVPSIERGNRGNNFKEITLPFDNKFTASVSVKVGNLVKELIIENKDKYIDGYHDKDGNYISSTYIAGPQFRNGDAFLELTSAGIEIDFSNVWLQYQKMLEKGEHMQKVQKRLDRWNTIRNRRNVYINSWVQNFESILRNDTNKQIQAALLSTSFSKTSMKAFTNPDAMTSLSVEVNYKGYKVDFEMEDGSFIFRGYAVNNSDENVKRTSIEDGKKRRAKREGTLFLKYVQAIDAYIATTEYQKKKREEQISDTEKKRLMLEKASGYPVFMKEEMEYSRNHTGRHSGHSWMTQKFYLVTKQPESYYDSFKGIQISTDGGENPKFTVKGCNDLREDQFKTIVDVLVDGREIFPEVITPKRPE